MPYIVRRTLKVGGEQRNPGEPVPEAETWPRLGDWISAGYVEEVEEEQEEQKQEDQQEAEQPQEEEPANEPGYFAEIDSKPKPKRSRRKSS